MYGQVAKEDRAELHFDSGTSLPNTWAIHASSSTRARTRRLPHLQVSAATSIRPRSHPARAGARPRVRIGNRRLRRGRTGRPIGTCRRCRLHTRTARESSTAARPRQVRQVSFVEASIDALPFDDETFDAVTSNGVINLSVVKHRVFRGGRARASTRWAARARKHRQRQATQGKDQAQHRTWRRLHRPRDPTDELHRHDPGRRLSTSTTCAATTTVRLRTRAQRLQHQPSRKLLARCNQARVTLDQNPLPDGLISTRRAWLPLGRPGSCKGSAAASRASRFGAEVPHSRRRRPGAWSFAGRYDPAIFLHWASAARLTESIGIFARR
jgi:hypothetical protein